MYNATDLPAPPHKSLVSLGEVKELKLVSLFSPSQENYEWCLRYYVLKDIINDADACCHWLIKSTEMGRSEGNCFSLIPSPSVLWNTDHFGGSDLHFPQLSPGGRTAPNRDLLLINTAHISGIKKFRISTDPWIVELEFLFEERDYFNCNC